MGKAGPVGRGNGEYESRIVLEPPLFGGWVRDIAAAVRTADQSDPAAAQKLIDATG